MTEEETQPTEQIEAPEQPIEQQENEQIEVPEQPNEDSNEQTGEDEEKDKNVTLMSMKLRSQPPHRRLPTQIAELQDPELYDIERGVKKNPIQLRKGPHNRMPRQVVEFQDKVLFNPETQIRKNPIELRKSPRGRRYSHVVSAAMNGDPLIANSQLPYKLQYNNEAEDVIGSSAAASPVKSQKGNGNKNEEESGVESATSSSSNYQDSIPKSMSSLHDYNDFGNGSNSDNGEQKEQKENPLRSRTGPKRRVSSEVAPLLDQSKLEVKDRSANLPDFIEGVESNEYNQLDMNDTNNYGDNEPWVLNDEQPIEEIGEVKERKINLDDMLEGQELSEQPTQLDRDDISNYANNQPWVILPRFDAVERSINLEEDDQSYQTVGEDGRTYADNAPWVVQDEESLNNGSQQEPQIKERETVIIQQPQETEENYQTVGEDGRNYADSAPWVVQGEDSLNNAENSNQPTEETQESHSSQEAQTNENEFNDNNDQDDNYQTIGEDGRKYADGAPWVVQDEDSLQTTEESPKPEQTTANQNRIENVIEQQPETDENYQTVGDDGRKYADGAPWVVQDEEQLKNQQEEQENQEAQQQPEEGEAGKQEPESGATNEQPEEIEENYETIGEDGRKYADEAPWVVKDEDKLKEQQQQQQEGNEETKQQEPESGATNEQPEEAEDNYETIGEDGRKYADEAPWVVKDEESLKTTEDSPKPEEAQEREVKSQEPESSTNEQQPETDENYQTVGDDGRKYADGAPWVVQDEEQLKNQQEEQENQEPQENQEAQQQPEEGEAGKQEPESGATNEQPEEIEENYETIGEDGRKYADEAPWVVKDEDKLNNLEEEEQVNEEIQQPEEGQENQEGEAGEQEPESGVTNEQPEEVEDNYETIGEDGRKYADEAPWVVKDEDKLKDQQQEQEEGNEEIQQPEEGQENQEGEAGEQEPESGVTNEQPEEVEDNYETIGEDGRKYADEAPWVVKDEDQINNPEEEQGNEEVQQPEEGQENQEGEAGEQEPESGVTNEQPDEAEENYETIGEDGRKYADEAPWVVKDEDKLKDQQEEEELVDRNQEIEEEPTTKPEEGPRKMKKKKNVKKVQVKTQTNESYIKDHLKDNNKQTKSEVKTRSLNAEEKEPASQQASSKSQNKPAQKQQATAKKQSTTANEPKNSTKDKKQPATTKKQPTKTAETTKKQPSTTSETTKKQPTTTTETAKKQPTTTTKKQPATTTKKQPAAATTKKQPTTTTTKKQEEEKASESAKKPTTTKSAKPTTTTKNNNTATTKKQPASSTTNNKPTESKTSSGKQGTNEPKLDKNDPKNYADNQPWVVHDEDEAAKKPTTTTRSAKTTTSSKKQPESTSKKQPTTSEPKKSTTSSKKQPSTTESNSKQATTSSSKSAPKKDTKKTNNTSSTAENKKPATKKTTKSNPENEVISGKPSKTQSKPLDKDDEKNYADNQPWVIHDESQNAASSSTAPKKTKTTTKKGSTPSNKQEQANKEEEKKQPTTTRSAKIDNNTASTKKQSTAKSTQKQPATNKTAKSQQQSKNTKTQQKKQANENESFKAESLDDLPPKVRNSPIGKKIMSAEKTTSEAWRKQGLLNSFIYGLPKVVKPATIVASPTKSKASKSDLYGESEMRDFIKKEINNRKDDNEYKFNVCIVGQHLSGKSTLLSLFTDELLQDMTTNESWKSTFIFIHDCSSFIPSINNYNVLYKNMVEVSVGCIVWSRPQLLFFKKDLENYLFDAIKSQSLPKEGFLQDHDLSDEEVEKVDEYIDRDKVNELGEEIHQKWNDNDFQEIYQLIFELPMKLALSCKFDKFIYILDHVDDCISIQVNPKTETEENENNNEDNNEISLNQVMSEMLDNTNCIVSCHDHDKFIQLKKDFDIIDISTILNNSKNKNNNRFSVQIKEQPKKNLELTVDHLVGAPAFLAEWEKMSETANLIKKAKNNEKVELENTLRIQTQNLINVVYAGEIEQGGDKTVEKVQLLDKKRTSK